MDKFKYVDNDKREMVLPISFIHQSFRYVLGRMTYAVSMWCDWAVDNWDQIPEFDRGIIQNELEAAFRRDDKDRAEGNNYNRLGHDCDRADWARVRNLWPGK